MANDPLPSDSIVYRAIRRSLWIIEGELQYTAFVLNTPKEEIDLSILTEANCRDMEYCAAVEFNKCYGEISLKAGTFLGLGLEAVYTPLPNIPHHASVFGLPPYYEEENLKEESEARNIAEEILKGVLHVERRKYDEEKIAKLKARLK